MQAPIQALRPAESLAPEDCARPARPRHPAEGAEDTRLPVSLRVCDLRWRYGDAGVLCGVSLDFPKGRLTGILGPNGSGKSTLLKLLGGVLRAPAGKVFLGDTDIARIPTRSRARQIALVPQREQAEFDFTALEVVQMGRHPHQAYFTREHAGDRQICLDALASVGALELKDRIVTTLSGGEWQRVMIARALAQRTDTLLLDEPTSALDIGYQVEILSLLLAQVHEHSLTAVCVLHDLNLAAQFCDHLALLHAGRVRATGSPEEVLRSELLSEVYEVPLLCLRHPQTGRILVVPEYT